MVLSQVKNLKEHGHTIDGDEFSGVFCRMKYEAGTDVMTFSAVGQNESVWGVKYFD